MGLSSSAYAALEMSGALALMRRANAAPIFCFHNVVPDQQAGLGDRSLHLPLSRFRAALDWIAATFTCLPVSGLAGRLAAGSSVRGLAALTFDDCYAGAITHAIPLLVERRLPATLFVIGAAPDRTRPFWWDSLAMDGRWTDADRARCLTELAGDEDRIREAMPLEEPDLPEDYRPATWSSLAACRWGGLSFGVHTTNHPNLARVSPDRVRIEIEGARTLIGEKLGEVAPLLAYPYGYATRETADVVERCGFTAALTLGFGRARSRHRLAGLPRINIPSSISLTSLRSWASGVRLGRPPIRLQELDLGTSSR